MASGHRELCVVIAVIFIQIFCTAGVDGRLLHRYSRLFSQFRTELDCEYLSDGAYPNTHDCHSFFLCRRGRSFPYMCPQSSQFNPTTKQCQWTTALTCNAPTPLTPLLELPSRLAGFLNNGGNSGQPHGANHSPSTTTFTQTPNGGHGSSSHSIQQSKPFVQQQHTHPDVQIHQVEGMTLTKEVLQRLVQELLLKRLQEQVSGRVEDSTGTVDNSYVPTQAPYIPTESPIITPISYTGTTANPYVPTEATILPQNVPYIPPTEAAPYVPTALATSSPYVAPETPTPQYVPRKFPDDMANVLPYVPITTAVSYTPLEATIVQESSVNQPYIPPISDASYIPPVTAPSNVYVPPETATPQYVPRQFPDDMANASPYVPTTAASYSPTNAAPYAPTDTTITNETPVDLTYIPPNPAAPYVPAATTPSSPYVPPESTDPQYGARTLTEDAANALPYDPSNTGAPYSPTAIPYVPTSASILYVPTESTVVQYTPPSAPYVPITDIPTPAPYPGTASPYNPTTDAPAYVPPNASALEE